MGAEEIKNEISKLAIAEKLLLVENIWDEIAESNETLPITDWQKEALDERMKAFESSNEQTIPWQEAHNQLRAKYK